MSVNRYFNIIKNFITNPIIRFGYLSKIGFYNNMPDDKYLKYKFKILMGKELNLDNPKTFNEKLQWLKLHNRKEQYSIMVDKYRVREYIAKKIGTEYLIPLLGVWNNPEDIDFSALPNQFVLKCNHNSGKGMCICRDKSKLDIKKVKKELKEGLKENYYLSNREWPYKNVPRKIIAEKYMSDSNELEANKGLTDYKFYCFDGKVKFLYVSTGLENHETARISFLNIDWTFANFGRTDYLPLEKLPPKPLYFDEMLKIAEKLSKGYPFLRVDLYEIKGQIYFGELTFSPAAGFMPFNPSSADLELGKMLKLKSRKI